MNKSPRTVKCKRMPEEVGTGTKETEALIFYGRLE